MGTDRDRFAVWDREEHGELIAYGDWRVSDAERAVAGRETVAARSLALLTANRDRAAQQYAGGEPPDGEEITRVWFPRDTASLEKRLGVRQLAAWAEDGVLHVLWRGEADQARLTGGLNLPLWPVEGAVGLWEASARVRRLDEAMISISVAVIGTGDTLLGRPTGEPVVFRGGHAPDPVPDHPLAGELQEHVLESAALGTPRGITEYLPPRADGNGPLPAWPTDSPRPRSRRSWTRPS